ncbi:MAG: hypothetical protein P1T08_18530 [Acidimicrobiia bacterium]|nr:hypothetical protein [Acidimicrobiia bacterium]
MRSSILVNAASELVVVVDVGTDVVVSDCGVVVDVADSSGPSVVVVAPPPQAATSAITARRSIARSLIRNLPQNHHSPPSSIRTSQGSRKGRK